MVDWNSPEILRLSLLLFRQTAVFVLGSYIWYIALTFKDVELRLILGRMTFRVAHIPYFLARYMNACELLTIVLSSYIPRTVHSCGPVALPIIITAVSGNVALAASSTNIAFRVIVLWKHHKWVSQLLAVICVVDISLAVLLGAFSVDSLWDDEHQFCVISAGRTQRGLLSLYCFTVVWHIVILILTFIGIRRSDVLAQSSPLLSMLYQQSLGYAVLMCVTCIPMAIIVYLNLNSIVNVLPALVGTTIADDIFISRNFPFPPQ
ncbi:hypothetical protein BC629DRAFT_336346 [Irpex lacteus]|nr:hypothetical protein BC629DRAFT_336346 [Irpex lacteus]